MDRDAHPPHATTVRLGGHDPLVLPSEAGAAREAALDQLVACLAAAREALPHVPVEGDISAPRPRGPTVSHGDVVAVLDAFRRAGIEDVAFEGAPPPLPFPNPFLPSDPTPRSN